MIHANHHRTATAARGRCCGNNFMGGCNCPRGCKCRCMGCDCS